MVNTLPLESSLLELWLSTRDLKKRNYPLQLSLKVGEGAAAFYGELPEWGTEVGSKVQARPRLLKAPPVSKVQPNEEKLGFNLKPGCCLSLARAATPRASPLRWRRH